MDRPAQVTSADVALLRALARERSVVGASRRVGMSRDRAVYRLERLAHAFGGAVVASARGGAAHGESVLTPLGDRIVRGGFDSVELLDGRPLAPEPPPNLLHGTYRAGPAPEVVVGRALRLRVAFPAADGERVGVVLDPEAIVVARRRFRSSARNVLPAVVVGLRPGPGGLDLGLVVRCAGHRVRVAMTDDGVRQLGVRPGVRLWLYVKATALRRVGGAGRPA
jgi:molybdate transport repressor ModE-like protein